MPYQEEPGVSGSKAAKAAGGGEDLACGVAKIRAAGILAKSLATNILAVIMPMSFSDDQDLEGIFPVELVVLGEENRYIRQHLNLQHFQVFYGDGKHPSAPAAPDDTLTYGELNLSTFEYVRGLTCDEAATIIEKHAIYGNMGLLYVG